MLQYLWDQASSLAAIGLPFGFWYFLQNYSSLANKSYGSAWLVVQAAALLLILLVGTVFWLVRLGLPSESAWVPFGHGRVT